MYQLMTMAPKNDRASGETTGWRAVGWSLVAFGFLAVVVLVTYYTDSFDAVTAMCGTIGVAVFFMHMLLWGVAKR
jgi:hypothetical protein